jgi:hypothetical protein
MWKQSTFKISPENFPEKRTYTFPSFFSHLSHSSDLHTRSSGRSKCPRPSVWKVYQRFCDKKKLSTQHTNRRNSFFISVHNLFFNESHLCNSSFYYKV